MNFEKLEFGDLEYIKQLSPDSWGDITPKIELYIKMDFCYTIKLVENNKIIGIGTAIFYENTSWIAHLIVNQKYRNNGYGTKILDYLCDYCRKNGYKKILLFATDMGYPLYIKYGFKVQTEYVLYEKTIETNYNFKDNISDIKLKDREKIFELDKFAVGEGRKELLLQFISDGLIYKQNNIITGFYLQSLGEGLIIANNIEAGMELLKLRISKNKQSVIPVDNLIANEYFRENKFTEMKKVRRMIFGNGIEYKNENIYNRIGGNFG